MITDILNTILIVVIFIIIYCLYSELRDNIIIDYIIRDAKNTYGFNFDKSYVKSIVHSKYGMFRFFNKKRSLYTDGTDDILYKKSNYNVERFAYCIVGALCTRSEHFNYVLFEHCEKRLIKINTEHDYMHTCLNRLLRNAQHGIDEYTLQKCLALFCEKYIKIDYEKWNETSVHLKRMVHYAEIARDRAISGCPNYMKDDLNLFFDLYIEELRGYWDTFTRY